MSSMPVSAYRGNTSCSGDISLVWSALPVNFSLDLIFYLNHVVARWARVESWSAASKTHCLLKIHKKFMSYMTFVVFHLQLVWSTFDSHKDLAAEKATLNDWMVRMQGHPSTKAIVQKCQENSRVDCQGYLSVANRYIGGVTVEPSRWSGGEVLGQEKNSSGWASYAGGS